MKMIKSCCVFLLICWMVLPLMGQGWERTYEIEIPSLIELDFGPYIISTDDGGHIIVATVDSLVNTSIFPFFIKIDKEGNEEWRKAWNNHTVEVVHSVVRSSNNEISIISQDPNTGAFYLKKIDLLGNLLWEKEFENNFNDDHNSVIKNTGQYILMSKSINSSEKFILRNYASTSGDMIWSKEYNISEQENKNEYLRDVTTLSDESLLMVGSTLDTFTRTAFLCKIDDNGNVLWNKEYTSDTLELSGQHVIEKDNGNLLLFCGTRNRAGFFAIETDSNGNTIEQTNYDDFTYSVNIKSIAVTPANDYYMSLRHNDVLKMSETGEILWHKDIQSRESIFLEMHLTHNNGLLFTGRDNGNITLTKTDSIGNVYTNHITGNLYRDNDQNCQQNPEDIAFQHTTIQATSETNTFYTTTDSTGYFDLETDTGHYQVQILVNNQIWQPCEENISVHFSEFQTSEQLDISILALVDCPALTVSITTPRLRRCFDNTIYVEYHNEGSTIAENAYVEVVLDTFLNLISAAIPYEETADFTYRFPIGDVAVGEGGTFTIAALVSCEAELGQTHCVAANIFPDTLCAVPSPLWSGASLSLEGYCSGDSLHFIIKNQSEQNMNELQQYIIIVDDVVLFEQDFQLFGNEQLQLNYPADGRTWRVETAQVAFHPIPEKLGLSIEGCGTDEAGNVSLGFVTPFYQHTQASGDKFCMENIGAYDPNDKQALPRGITNEHFIAPQTPVDYQIRFQNTGTDTAFQVVIRDTLSQHLDISTFRAGASSHAYDWEIFGSGVLKFTFSNIMLPDSHVNVAASQGFINFKISPKESLALGTVLENRAGIYFDYNAPILTNTVSHTLQLDYLPHDTAVISISGQIFNRHGQPEPDVLVTMPNVGEYLTGEDGTYYFSNLNHEGHYNIIPDKRTFQEPNISVLDILHNRQLAIGLMTELFSDFYAWWAAVPHGGSDLTFAAILTHQKILGKRDSFPNHHSWRFVPSAYDFNTVSMPFSTPFPEQISIAQPLTDVEKQDFVSIHLGDIWASPLPPLDAPEPVFELVPSQDTITSSDFYVDLKVSDFVHIAGLQFTIEWDTNLLVLNDFENIVFPIENISHYTNTDLYEQGKCPFIWYEHIGQSLSLDDETVLCRWHFSSLQVQVETTSIAFAPTPTRPEVVFSDNAQPEDSLVILNTQFIDANFPIALSTSTSTVSDAQNWTIFPNPVTDFLYVQGQLPQVQKGQIRLYNALGQVVLQKYFEAPQVDLTLDLSSLPTGFYELEIYTAMKTWRKKLVLQ